MRSCPLPVTISSMSAALVVHVPDSLGSLALVGDFFPSLKGAAESIAPILVSFLFPLGPEPSVGLLVLGQELRMRQPFLLPLAVLGVMIGLTGYCHMISSAKRTKALPRQASWAFAFLYFAGMNASAVVCHCLSTRLTTLYQVFGTLDIAFTGCSSACLAIASSLEHTAAKRQRAETAHCVVPWMWAPICAVALAANLLYPGVRCWLNEAIYIFTTLYATGVLYINEVLPAPRGTAEAWHIRAAGAGALVLTLAAQFDRPLRAATGGWLSGVHAAFLACDVAFLQLGKYLEAKQARLAKAA